MNKYILLFIESQWYSLNLDNHDEYQKSIRFTTDSLYVTFQTSDLIRYFKEKHVRKLPIIIDLECLDKQMSQEGKEFRGHSSWKAIQALRYHKIIDEDFELTKSTFKVFLEHLASLYSKLYEKDNLEQNRFVNLEMQVNSLIYERQFKGIKINLHAAREKSIEVERKIYDIKNRLQIEHNIFVPNAEKQQIAFLEQKGYNIINSPRNTFKIRRYDDPVCNLFYELIRNEQDLESLIYIQSHWGGESRTYPTYYGFGTITSRIMLRQPALQNLKKDNRSVIIPERGMKLLYIDYSQFEAGILASLSGDENLISLYNTDIYIDLAEKVLGSELKRKEAKIIFYRYMYGDTTLGTKALEYFNKFVKLKEFMEQTHLNASVNRKVGTTNGNFRYTNGEDYNWSLSHVIQSTASLILKNALVRVHTNVTKAEFLIPMHDAALYQIKDNDYEKCKTEIIDIYIEEFKKLCPKIKASIDTEPFYPTRHIAAFETIPALNIEDFEKITNITLNLDFET